VTGDPILDALIDRALPYEFADEFNQLEVDKAPDDSGLWVSVSNRAGETNSVKIPWEEVRRVAFGR